MLTITSAKLVTVRRFFFFLFFFDVARAHTLARMTRPGSLDFHASIGSLDQ